MAKPTRHEFDFDRLSAASMVASIDVHAELESTSDRALELIADSRDLDLPLLVLADRQLHGRGRRDHRWTSATGDLTFSIILDRQRHGLDARRLPALSITAALSVHEALEGRFASDPRWPASGSAIKWPNDVLVDDRKACGILVDVPPTDPVCVVGIGINVNGQLPASLAGDAVGLSDVLARDVDRCELLIDVLARLDDNLARLADGDEDLPNRWHQAHRITGRTIELVTGTGTVTGCCERIDADGALVLGMPDGPRRFLSARTVRVVDDANAEPGR